MQEDLIHICINKQKLNEDQETIARTTIYGLSVHYDLEEMVRHWKTVQNYPINDDGSSKSLFFH